MAPGVDGPGIVQSGKYVGQPGHGLPPAITNLPTSYPATQLFICDSPGLRGALPGSEEMWERVLLGE